MLTMEPSLTATEERHGTARLLDAPVRRQILDLVARQPGLPVGELQALLGVGWGTLHHHLRKLEDADLIHTSLVGRRRLVHLGRDDPHAGLAILRGRTARRIAETIASHPAISITDVARLTGGSPRAVYYHVKRLVEAGLVATEGQTRYARLAPTPLLPPMLRDTPPPGDLL